MKKYPITICLTKSLRFIYFFERSSLKRMFWRCIEDLFTHMNQGFVDVWTKDFSSWLIDLFKNSSNAWNHLLVPSLSSAWVMKLYFFKKEFTYTHERNIYIVSLKATCQNELSSTIIGMSFVFEIEASIILDSRYGCT